MRLALHLSAWSGFLGAWLLFAGPLFQAALELKAYDADRDPVTPHRLPAWHAALDQASRTLPAVERPSVWWWLLPPALYIIKRYRLARHKSRTLASLPLDQREQGVAFLNKATGWFMVAGGGLLLAGNETWQFVQQYAMSVWSFWGISAVMMVLSTLHTAARMIVSERVLHGDAGTPR